LLRLQPGQQNLATLHSCERTPQLLAKLVDFQQKSLQGLRFRLSCLAESSRWHSEEYQSEKKCSPHYQPPNLEFAD
jgi:hypothetical protein